MFSDIWFEKLKKYVFDFVFEAKFYAFFSPKLYVNLFLFRKVLWFRFLNVFVPPTETKMREKKSGAFVAVMLLLTVSFPGGGVSAGPDCSPVSSAETNVAVRLLSAVVDSQKAERSQRRHLEALFNRWGPGRNPNPVITHK